MENESGEIDVYECANYERDYDQLGKYHWCNAGFNGKRECDCDYIYAM